MQICANRRLRSDDCHGRIKEQCTIIVVYWCLVRCFIMLRRYRNKAGGTILVPIGFGTGLEVLWIRPLDGPWEVQITMGCFNVVLDTVNQGIWKS